MNILNPSDGITKGLPLPEQIKTQGVLKKYKVKQPFWLFVAGVMLCIILYFIYDRLELIHIGEHVTGIVSNITSYNSRCGSRRSKYNCTKYTAYVDFTTLRGENSQFTVGGGSSRGHNQSISYSTRNVGGPVQVIYDPRYISRVYEDTLWGIWGVPIMTFFFQIISFFSAFSEPKKNH